MARVTYSPLIVEMSGKCADAVFARWKGIDYVRSRVTPANPQSAAQTLQRNALKNTLTMWQSVKSWAKTVWDTYATGYAWSGYNRYMDYNILLVKAGTAGKLTPYNADFIKISVMGATQGGAGEIACTWTNDTAVGGVDKLAFFSRKTETGSEAYAWTFHDYCAPEAEFFTLAGLDTGKEYEIAFACGLVDLSVYQESYNEVLLAG